MKKFSAIFLAAILLVVAVPFTVLAADEPANLPYITSKDVSFISYSGDDTATGDSADSAKKTFGAAKSSGAVGKLAKGGTLVASGKAYLAKSYNLPKLSSPLLITSVYGGTDYQKNTPVSNPDCAMKMAGNAFFTIQSDVIIDDIIIFQESKNPTGFIVERGATLVIGKNVTNMSNQDFQVKITVNAGGRLIVGGGNFDIENNGGEIIEGYTYDYLKVNQSAPVVDNTEYTDKEPGVGFIAYNEGSDSNDGLTAATAKKTAGSVKANGAISLVAGGGTLVIAGRFYMPVDFTIPKLGSYLTITGKYDGVNYVNAEPAENPAGGTIKMATGKTLTIGTDARLENLIFFQEGANQVALRISDGATVTIGENVVCMSKQVFNPKIIVDAGSTLIFENAEHNFETIEGDGIVVMPETEVKKTEIKMTVDSMTAYVNGVATTLDAAPVIKFDRTMLPVRFVAENLGATVGWDGATQTVSIKSETVTIEIVIGATTAKVNGAEITLDSPAYIEPSNNRTYLPVRVVAENLGATVGWDGATRTAILTK